MHTHVFNLTTEESYLFVVKVGVSSLKTTHAIAVLSVIILFYLNHLTIMKKILTKHFLINKSFTNDNLVVGVEVPPRPPPGSPSPVNIRL